MSFAEEVAKAKPGPKAETEVKFDKTEIFAMPAAEAAPEAPPALPTGEAPVDPKAVKESKDPVIKIGDMEFHSKEDAIEYAKLLDQQRREEHAYVKGVKDAMPKPPEEPVKSLEEQVEEILFEDPKTAVAKITNFVKDTVNNVVTQSFQSRDQAAIQQAESVKFWNEFKEEHKDLANHQDLMKYVYSQDVEGLEALAMRNRAEAKQELAKRARAILRINKQDTLPETELSSQVPTVVASNGGRGAPVAAQSNTMSFVQQVNKMRKKG